MESLTEPDSIIEVLAAGDGIQRVVAMMGRDERHAGVQHTVSNLQYQANIAARGQKTEEHVSASHAEPVWPTSSAPRCVRSHVCLPRHQCVDDRPHRVRDSDGRRRCRASHESRDLPLALLTEHEQVAIDNVGVRRGEAVRQARIVDFHRPFDQLC